MIVSEALRQGTTFLLEHGSASARLDAEVLLAHVLGVRRVDLYIDPQRPLVAQQEEVFGGLLERRSRGEPASYILGRKEFFGLTLVVDQRVMVPRPETEILVGRTLERARALGRGDLRIADIGTGSGCIAVALAAHLPDARLYATEASPQAGEVAEQNFRRWGLAGRVELLLGDLCAPLPESVDLLVSNPPYTVWPTLPAGITSFEPRLALDGGADGLVVYRRLLPQMPAYLCPGGFALLEIGDGQAPAVLDLADTAFAGVPRRTWPDYSGVERVVEIGPWGGRPG